MNETEFSEWLTRRKVDLSALPAGWPLDEDHVAVSDDGRAFPRAGASNPRESHRRAIKELARRQKERNRFRRSCSVCQPGGRRCPRQRASHGSRHSSARSSARSGDSPSGSDDPGGDPPPQAAREDAEKATGPGAPCQHCGDPIPEFKQGATRRTPSHAKTCSENCSRYLRAGREKPSDRLTAVGNTDDVADRESWHRIADKKRPTRIFRPSLIPWGEVDSLVAAVFEEESAGRAWHGRRVAA